MGARYVLYRVSHELEKKTGILKRRFPEKPNQKYFISLDEWRKNSGIFLFDNRETLELVKRPTAVLQKKAENIFKGRLIFFSSLEFDLGKDYDWLTNPDSGYKYDKNKHWSEINDFNLKAGDIKYVWEKSRFSYIHTVLRYDYHFEEDHADWVFSEIDSWIVANPVNCGPNFRCSQEISLRLFNWCYILHFYKGSSALTEIRWQSYQHYIYWQLHHVYNHIDFSRIAVRNNHAITETALLSLSEFLFPFIPETEKWSIEGRKWLEEEIAYQIYDDGTFLQNSMNYHRVVIQILTLVLVLTQKSNKRLSDCTYKKAYDSVNFLYQCQQVNSGLLPNIGPNDGALFFQFSESDYQDFRPQLNSLHLLLTGKKLYNGIGPWEEDASWFGISSQIGMQYPHLKQLQGSISFPTGGYYLIRDEDTLSLIRCVKYKNRPGHADNLHLDIWKGDVNIFHDSGSYKYNTLEDIKRYFRGTKSHNTVALGDFDQMQMGERFIWYNWSEAIEAKFTEGSLNYEFQGVVKAFGHLAKGIVHIRTINKRKGKDEWIVKDEIRGLNQEYEVKQLWHTSYPDQVIIQSVDEPFQISKVQGYKSLYYGIKESCTDIIIASKNKIIETAIKIK